jgi:hypothetical protein
MFAGTGTFGGHGSVSASDWATYLTMSNTSTRGWIFRRGTTNVASISGHGNLAVNGTATIAGGSSTNWASANIGGSNSINAAGNIYSYSRICAGNASGSCNSTGGVVIAGSGTNTYGNVI